MRVLSIILFLLLAITANATTYTVNSPLDFPDDDVGDGVCDSTLGTFCTLRAAIQEANSDSTADTIVFSFSSGTGILAISLTNGALPTITQTLNIDGRTVAGYNDSSGDVKSTRPRMFLFGANTTGGADGFRFSGSGASNSSVYGFGIIDFADNGIEIVNGAEGIAMDANWIGLHWSEFTARANGTGIETNSDFTIIGTGGLGGIGNMISGNTNQGIVGSGSNLLVHANHFGFTSDSASLPNGGAALEFIGSSATITSNKFLRHSIGISMITSNSTIRDNSLGGSGDGIKLVGGNLIVTENSVHNCGSGITLTGSDNSLIDRNDILNSASTGILLEVGSASSDNNDITNNWITGAASGAGIYINGGDDNLIAGNRLRNINTSGIIVSGDDNFVAGNRLGYFSNGNPSSFTVAPINGNGIVIEGNRNNVGRNRSLIEDGNIIATGTADWMDGVDVWSGGANNYIGHNFIGVHKSQFYEEMGVGGEGIRVDRNNLTIIFDNVIGFARHGINIESATQLNYICGNRIGVTNDSPSSDIGNREAGIYLEGNSTRISPVGCTGGPVENYIGFNKVGVLVEGDSNVLEGSIIGTDSEEYPAPNDTHGVLINSGGNNDINPRLIAHNTGNGVVLGNSAGTSNDIWIGVKFFNNGGGLDIDLGDNGVTNNDPGDLDSGPNLLMNYPVITKTESSSGVLSISYRLDYDTATTNGAEIIFYLDTASGSRAFATDTYNESANVVKTFDFTVPVYIFPGNYSMRARAVDNSANNSEFTDVIPITIQAPSDEIFEDSFES